MNYDSFCMAAASEELRAESLGAFVDQVYQPDPLVVVLALTGRGPRRFWLFSSDARWARAHATREKRPNPGTPAGFCMLLRKHLGGSRLTAVEQVGFDRILRLTFRRGETECQLVHEVMSRHSNLILVDEAGVILGAVKNVPPAQTRVRPVLTGLPYQSPPGARPDPRRLSLPELEQILVGAHSPEAITRGLSGWGTFAAREALALALCAQQEHQGDWHRLAGEDRLAGADRLAGVMFGRMEAVRRNEYAPTVFLDPLGRPAGLWTFPSIQEGWRRGHPAPSISAACDELYQYLQSHAAEEARRKLIAGATERVLRTARLQLAEAEAAFDGLAAAEMLKVKGELLSSGASRVERGAASVKLPNWYHPEQRPLLVELDPELDARENAARYFHRYRRATAAAEAALERIPQTRELIGELEALLAAAHAASGEDLERLHAEAQSRGLFRTQDAAPQPGKRPEPGFPSGVRIRRVPVGRWEVLYGENATSNDFLTTRIGRPGDLWLHARAVTGAHVLIRGVAALDRLPPEVLREAARIAAAHSEAKHSSVVPVDYTFRRYVRKRRGSPPGSVTYSGERTLHVEPLR